MTSLRLGGGKAQVRNVGIGQHRERPRHAVRLYLQIPEICGGAPGQPARTHIYWNGGRVIISNFLSPTVCFVCTAEPELFKQGNRCGILFGSKSRYHPQARCTEAEIQDCPQGLLHITFSPEAGVHHKSDLSPLVTEPAVITTGSDQLSF